MKFNDILHQSIGFLIVLFMLISVVVVLAIALNGPLENTTIDPYRKILIAGPVHTPVISLNVTSENYRMYGER